MYKLFSFSPFLKGRINNHLMIWVENPLTGKQGDVARGKLIIFILICKNLFFTALDLFHVLSRILGSDDQIFIDHRLT